MNPPLDPSSWGLVRFRLGTILVVLCFSHQTRVGLVQLGRLPERPMGADCKSVGLRLRRFESCTCHRGQAPFPGGLTCSNGSELSPLVTSCAELSVPMLVEVASGNAARLRLGQEVLP